jgi:repressor LexA
MENITNYVSNKIKEFREQKNITQQELAEALNTTQQSIARYESGERKADQNILFALADFFKVSINDFFPPITFDNATLVDVVPVETIKIPVLGVIKAGMPIEAQQNILEYIDIPKEWTKGGKRFYGLKISGDSMSPKYQPNDIVIFEQNEDSLKANGRDCAVMVNGNDATFKKFTLNDNGIILTPLNQDNQDGYQTTFYTIDQVLNLPIKIVGIAIEKRTKL